MKRELATGESEAATAARLGLDRPWAHPDLAGQCPGSAPYGHGLSLTVVHGGCCAAWDQARAAAGAAAETEAAEADPEAGPYDGPSYDDHLAIAAGLPDEAAVAYLDATEPEAGS